MEGCKNTRNSVQRRSGVTNNAVWTFCVEGTWMAVRKIIIWQTIKLWMIFIYVLFMRVLSMLTENTIPQLGISDYVISVNDKPMDFVNAT